MIFLIVGFILSIILIFMSFVPGQRKSTITGGSPRGRSVSTSDILDYLDEYIRETDGDERLVTYMNGHFDMKEDSLKSIVRKIIADHDIRSIGQFLRVSQLSYRCFVPEEYFTVLYNPGIKYSITDEDTDRLLTEGKNAARELDYDDSGYEIRSVIRKRASSWLSLKIKKSKFRSGASSLAGEAKDNPESVFEVDYYTFRMYITEYIECRLLPEKERYTELRNVLSELLGLSVPGYLSSYADLLQFLREQRKTSYLRTPTYETYPPVYAPQLLPPISTAPPIPSAPPMESEIDRIAREYGLDPGVLEDYIKIYPDLTPLEIIRLIMQRVGGQEHDVDISEKARDLLEKIKSGQVDT